MRSCRQGFTLLEMMIVVTMIAILAAMAIPSLVAGRQSAHEGAVRATLRTLAAAQAHLQQTGRIDENGDGLGEYGGFVELSGGAPGRMAAPLTPPLLSGAFRALTPEGEVYRLGYLFAIYLPGARGAGVAEPQAGFAQGGGVDPGLCATAWCAYAWPLAYGQSGRRTYVTSSQGDVLSTEAALYSGRGHGPPPDSAFLVSGSITGPLAVGTAGVDGNIWR